MFPLCLSSRRTGNNIERPAIDGQRGWLERCYYHILGLSATNRRVIEMHAKPRDSTRQRQLSPLCLSPRRTGNRIERLAIDGQQEWLERRYNHILGLSATDRRVIETHAKPRDSTRQKRLFLLCPSFRPTRNNIESPAIDGQQEWLERRYHHHLRAICYRQKGDRDARQA